MFKKLWKRLFGPKYDFSKYYNFRYTESGATMFGIKSGVSDNECQEVFDPKFRTALENAIKKGKVKATKMETP